MHDTGEMRLGQLGLCASFKCFILLGKINIVIVNIIHYVCMYVCMHVCVHSQKPQKRLLTDEDRSQTAYASYWRLHNSVLIQSV